MNGNPRPEIKIPKIESALGADFGAGQEKMPEKKPDIDSKTSYVLPASDQVLGVQQAINATQATDQEIILGKVEEILSEGMDNIFLSLDVNKQVEFKKRGEETSRQISQILSKASVSVKKIVNLIIAWLRVIPHVNRFYLEQEAKIKTDKIMRLTKKS